jgi:tRNA nucleotidyltransferase (CCA-adding enzyme)
MKKETLKKILMEKDAVVSINNNLSLLLKMIPEIENMIGFEHKHPHHHLDVWNHTLLALSEAPQDFQIRLILLLHDIGKPFSYQEGEIRHFKNHPVVSCKMARDILLRLKFTDDEIEEICCLIEEHDNLIKEEDIINNKEFCKKKFKIQFCDALAHNPDKLEKRIIYLLEINDRLNEGKEKEKYNDILCGLKNRKK